MTNMMDTRVADSKFFSNFRKVFSGLQNLNQIPNRLLGQFASSASLSIEMGLPVFRNAVLHVIRVGSNKKVFWIATRRIVAMMADILSVWNQTKGNFPRNPMGKGGLGCELQPSITLGISTGNPLPTSIGLGAIDVAPKSLFLRHITPTSDVPQLGRLNSLLFEFRIFHLFNFPYCSGGVK